MARTIAEIQQQIINEVMAQPVLAAKLTSTSTVAIWRLWTYVVAVCIWTLESLLDYHKIEVQNMIALQKPHSLKWYEQKAKAFQYGYGLAVDEDYYDNTGIDPALIESSKVVIYASAKETSEFVYIKIAGESGGDLAPVPTIQFNAFKEYMSRVKDAGVNLSFVNAEADSLRAEIDIYYDPLILSPSGERLDGTSNTPVQDAIIRFLKGMDFAGLFVPAFFVDALQAVDGVVIPHPVSIQAKYGLLDWTSVVVSYLPDAGYLRIKNPGDLTVNFIPHEAI